MRTDVAIDHDGKIPTVREISQYVIVVYGDGQRKHERSSESKVARQRSSEALALNFDCYAIFLLFPAMIPIGIAIGDFFFCGFFSVM